MYLIQTVQTSWRPQLPLPKEIPAQFVQNSATMDSKSTKKDSPGNKKWSFGRFFRKKKDLETDSSSDDDRKAGFIAPQKPRKKEKRKRASKIVSPGFDHIVISPVGNETNEIFLPFEAIETTESIRSSGSADRRGRKEKRHRSSRLQVQRHSSSDEDVKSHNSSSLPRYRSDESIGSGGVVGNRRSRAARTERYYKRMSRDENTAGTMVTPQVGRWKTQPVQLTIYDSNRPHQGYYLKNSTSLSNVPNAQQYLYAVPNKGNQMNSVSSEKRSISYDNHIHLQNLYNKKEGIAKNTPPPPPPRDPLRRVHVPGQSELRPMSYAFDKSALPSYPMNNRCVSDDKLWGPEGSIYQSNIQRPSSAQPVPQPRRFITRADRDNNQNKVSSNIMGPDYKYIADAIPRSRKPIHILKSEGVKLEPSPNSAFSPPPPVIRTTKSGLPSPMQTASHFWKQIDQQEVQRRGRCPEPNRGGSSSMDKPRSVSSSRAGNGFPSRGSMQENFRAMNGRMNKSVDEAENVVSGNLYLKPTKDNEKNFIEVSTKPYANKSSSMPNYYQQQRQHQQQKQQQQQLQQRKTTTPPPNKYEEYIARKAPQNVIKPAKIPPPPPQRKSIRLSTEDLRKPATNLEDAINELEAIYNSLKLGDEDLLDRAERRDIPTPTNFEKYAVVSDEDEEQNNGEPDVVLDDVAYRNIQRANTIVKTIDPQPPFGIPVGPVPPSPNTDYLHVTPDKEQKKNRCVPQNVPDLVSDDLAVRALRKDVPGLVKPTVAFPSGSTKKKRAVRSMSANIYNIIQRDAAKPAGGNLFDFSDLDRALEKAGSLSDVRRDVDDVPSALQLLRNLRKDEKESPRKMSPVFRHPNQGGAVFNLPSTLKTSPQNTPHIVQKPPIPLPRKSHSPDPMKDTSGMEEVLNRIAKEAQESSEKLTRELKELRDEKINLVEKPMNSEISKMNDDIEEVSKAAKICGEVLSEIVPQTEETPLPKQRRLSKEEKLIKDIDETSEAAKVCEKILKDVVTIEPPVTVETAEIVSQTISEIQDFVDRKINEEVPGVSTGESKAEAVASEVDLIDFSDDSEVPKQIPLAVSTLLEKLDPMQSAQIGKIAERCMRQISELSDLQAEEAEAKTESMDKDDDQGDYDNLNSEPETSNTLTCKQDDDDIPDYDNIHGDHIAVVSERKESSEAMAPLASQDDDDEDIDKIMKECEDQVMHKTPYTSLSSSDCPKSSSPTSSRQKSSSITSIHALSSSDFVKSSSSEFHTPSTDPIKTFSTTSYDVNSSSPTPNITNSPLSTTPSPLFAPTPIGKNVVDEVADSQNKSQSQYNSSEELAMIFGMAPPVIASNAQPSDNASTITSTTTAATTGKKTLELKLTQNANACVAIANNHKNVATTTPSAITTVVAASTSPTSTISTSTSSTSGFVDDCHAVGENTCYYSQQQDQQHYEHDDDDDNANFITVASFKTPETCRLIRLVPSPISTTFLRPACLDTIPEMHDVGHDDDDDDKVDESDVDERFVVDNTNTFDHFSRFTNTSRNSMRNVYENDDVGEETRTSFSSNPDSGNVSLSDFPIHGQQHQLVHDNSVNTTLELSLLQNSQFTYSNLYPFVNQIEIQTVGEAEDFCSDNDVDLIVEENNIAGVDESAISDEVLNSDAMGNHCFEKQSDFGEARLDSPTIRSDGTPSELRNRSSLSQISNRSASLVGEGRPSRSCGMSQLSVGDLPGSKNKVPKYLVHAHARQGFLQHIIIACTCGVASHDFYTLVAIAFAVIVIIAIILI